MEETLSKYSRRFDKNSIDWWDNMDINRMFVKTQQQYFNDLLKVQGFVFLMDVYKAFGFPITRDSIVCGWWYDKDNPVGDNFIDFRIIEGPDYFDIDFNVDGEILSKF